MWVACVHAGGMCATGGHARCGCCVSDSVCKGGQADRIAGKPHTCSLRVTATRCSLSAGRCCGEGRGRARPAGPGLMRWLRREGPTHLLTPWSWHGRAPSACLQARGGAGTGSSAIAIHGTPPTRARRSEWLGHPHPAMQSRALQGTSCSAARGAGPTLGAAPLCSAPLPPVAVRCGSEQGAGTLLPAEWPEGGGLPSDGWEPRRLRCVLISPTRKGVVMRSGPEREAGTAQTPPLGGDAERLSSESCEARRPSWVLLSARMKEMPAVGLCR